MSLLVAADNAGILDRAVEIIAGMSNEPNRQINIGIEKVRQYIQQYYRVVKR